MCLPVKEARMPLSKVIKGVASSISISDFSLRAIKRGEILSTVTNDDAGSHFVPMDLFDPAELGVRAALLPQKHEDAEPPLEPEIPGSFISDVDLQMQLQDSYQRGLQDGKNLAERGLFNVFKSLRTAADDIQNLREKILRDSEDELLELVIALSRKVIHQETTQDRGIVLRVIKAAVNDLNELDELIIRVHPDDHALLSSSQNNALKNELCSVRFTLKADASLQPGCCLVETSLGTIDASFEAQLEEIYRRLLEERYTSTDVNNKNLEPL